MTYPPDVWLDALVAGHSPKGARWVDSFGLGNARRDGHVMALRGLTEGRWWLPCSGGDRLLVVPAYDPWLGGMTDIITIDPTTPNNVYKLTGHGLVLGSPLFRFDTIRVYQHVTHWLRDTNGLCLVDPTVAPELFTGTPKLTLQADNREHAIALRQVFEGAEGVIPNVVYANAADSYPEAAE